MQVYEILLFFYNCSEKNIHFVNLVLIMNVYQP